jgi:hydrogenase maturation protease
MTVAEAPIVVIGVGNILRGDDGAGARLVEALRTVWAADPTGLPEDTRLVDGGTLGLDLLRTVAGARALLLLDAVDLQLPPGSVRVLRGDDIVTAGGQWDSAADGGVGELLAIARLMDWLPDPVSLVGIQVDTAGFEIGLSAPVEAALPLAMEAARRELRLMDQLAVHVGPGDPRPGAPEGATA